MHARLTVIRGANTQQVDLRLPTIIGRGAAAKLKLPSSVVSRQHCEVYEYDGQIAIRDLGSSNGTVVNGHKIEVPTFITQDDEVAVGPVSFRLAMLESAAAERQSVQRATTEEMAELGHIPSATRSPQQAESVTGNELATKEESEAGKESVLKYVEPADDGERSFVGIETETPQPTEKVTESPPIDGENEGRATVEADESSLREFFNNLDG